MNNQKERYEYYVNLVDRYLDGVFSAMRKCPSALKGSMAYTVLDGGKRIRPVLLLGAVESLGGSIEEAIPAAAAIELVHTYSLIHDDLPCMDNDAVRRGKAANHVKYGEAMALLAGDALLTLAFEIVAETYREKPYLSKVIKKLALYAGYSGMIGGQAEEFSEGAMTEKRLLEIDRNKTGCLLRLPLELASVLCQKEEKIYDDFSEHFGLLFQFMDDLSDCKIDQTKSAVGFYGAEEVDRLAKRELNACLTCLDSLPNVEFLKYIVLLIGKQNENR